ncbi:uncharacterized protein RSE6_10653 [Rhynchosporium secalis]|uniref:Uncharacterized protein n=1 Tax=Rhynchosporium secalis TaxID=38038 RepID=A0A1E1MKZ7_RHYSE|nr:uncharacterized protein RSE6_10653 [Rhynchosporium secalis]
MAIQQRSSGVFSRMQSLVDNYIVTPSAREQYYKNTSTFAHDQPLIFTFLFTQLLLSSTPIALFLAFSLGLLLLSLVSALLFSLFWIGVALLVLVPTVFITVSLAIAVWVWALSSFLIARWVYNVVPVSVSGRTEVALPNGKTAVVEKTGDGFGDFKGAVKD